MIVSFLAMVMLVLACDENEPDMVTLIGRLGADTSEERIAAYKAIERLGGAALPALRAAADASDPLIQVKVRALIDSVGHQVENERFTRPTLIRLGFRDQPLGAIVDALNDRHDLGLALRLGPETRQRRTVFDADEPRRLKALRDRAVTLEAAGPVPFWEAVDRLCKAAALRYDVSPQTGFGTSRGSLVLMADRTGRGPVSDSGPFRVQITWAQSDFERSFPQGHDVAHVRVHPPGAGDLDVPLAIIPEPGLALHQIGFAKVEEAVDDQGRSMIPPASKPQDSTPFSDQGDFTNRASIHVNVRLRAPDPPGAMIRRLRGMVPVAVVAKRSEPIVIPLKEITGEWWVSTPEMTLTIDEVSLPPRAEFSLSVTIRPTRWGRSTGRGTDPRKRDFTVHDQDRVVTRLELRDANGRRLKLATRGHTRDAGGGGFYDRYRLTIQRDLENGPAADPKVSTMPIPSELRYYEFVQRVTDIPFDFRDLAMP
ncbi:MAG: hypothetical protein P4L84_29940 [Isosphaeraceae bacterium]|nr:hypothetical protein [Isosphaeraceae bacterium]